MHFQFCIECSSVIGWKKEKMISIRIDEQFNGGCDILSDLIKFLYFRTELSNSDFCYHEICSTCSG